MKNAKYNLKLEEGKAVAFDFDGVIHKYSKGWQDGSIYDEPNKDVLDLILMLQLMGIPCVIISTREPKQIKEWWNKQGITIPSKVLDWETVFYDDCKCVGITNRKLPAQIYIDDRAYRYTGQTVQEFLMDCSEKVEAAPKPLVFDHETEKVRMKTNRDVLNEVFGHLTFKLNRQFFHIWIDDSLEDALHIQTEDGKDLKFTDWLDSTYVEPKEETTE